MNAKTILFIFLLTLSGCTADLEQRIKRLESAMNDVRSFQAEQTTQIASVQGELRKLTGKTEEIEYTQNQKYGTDLNALKEDLSTLKRRVPPPANVPLVPLEEDEAISEKSGLTSFSDALLNLREGNYQDALPRLQDLAQSGPPEATPHILFWIGICDEGMSDYKGALTTYHDLTTQFPKHKRAPLAMLREASVFNKIGDGKAASITINKLIETYPNSPEAIDMRGRQVPPTPTKSSSSGSSSIVKKKK